MPQPCPVSHHLPFITGWYVVEPISSGWGDWEPRLEGLSDSGTSFDGSENGEAEWRSIGMSSKLNPACGVNGGFASDSGIAKSKSIGSRASMFSSRNSSRLNGLEFSWSGWIVVGTGFELLGMVFPCDWRICRVRPPFDLHGFEQIGHSHQIVDSEYWRCGLRAGRGIVNQGWVCWD